MAESLEETPGSENVYSTDGRFGDTPTHRLRWLEELSKIIIDPSLIPDGQSILISRYACPPDISHESAVFVSYADGTRAAFEMVLDRG